MPLGRIREKGHCSHTHELTTDVLDPQALIGSQSTTQNRLTSDAYNYDPTQTPNASTTGQDYTVGVYTSSPGHDPRVGAPARTTDIKVHASHPHGSAADHTTHQPTTKSCTSTSSTNRSPQFTTPTRQGYKSRPQAQGPWKSKSIST